MRYIKNNLFIDNKGIFDLANKYGTPLYCYSYNKLKSNIDEILQEKETQSRYEETCEDGHRVEEL